MPVKILIPLGALQDVLDRELVLKIPPRCSRCGSDKTGYYETHRLRLRASQYRGRFNRPAYHTSRKYTLKIGVCADCYKVDFLTDPDALTHDPTPLGRAARSQSIGTSIGALFAAAGSLLITPIIPPIGFLAVLKDWWPVIIAAGVSMVLTAWILQRSRQGTVRNTLVSRGIQVEDRPRADVRTPILEDVSDPETIPLEIGFMNESWAQECAAAYGWKSEKYALEE